MSGARFVRFYPSDWRSGCIGLTPEEEGVYMRVCAHFWETGVKLSLDDADAASRLMLDVRMWRRIKAKLISKGKLHVAEDGVFNPRAEKELTAANRAAKKDAPQADVGTAWGSSDGEPQDGRDQMEGWHPGAHAVGEPKIEVATKSERSRNEVCENFVKNASKINDPILEPIANSLSQIKNNYPPTEYAAREGGLANDPNYEKCKLAFNGSTDRFIDELRNAEGVYGTKARAAADLAKALDDYGAGCVVEAFRFLEEKRARGESVIRVTSLLWSTARTKAENLRAKQAKEADKKAGLKPIFNLMTREIEWRKPYEPYTGGHA